MTYFDESNFHGARHEIETANVAYDVAWGAIKGMIQRGTVKFSANLRRKLGDAIEDAFAPHASDEAIAVAALRAMGYRPIVGVFGEIEATAQ